jgi:hypothetical protein
LIQIDRVPGQPKKLGPPHPEIKGEHVQGVQPVVLRKLKDRPCLSGAQPAIDPIVRRLDLDELGDVAHDDVFAHRLLQPGAEHGVDVLDRADRQGLAAAVAHCAAVLFVGGSGDVDAVAAAAAVVLQPREHAPNVLNSESFELAAAELGHQVAGADALVALVGLGSLDLTM